MTTNRLLIMCLAVTIMPGCAMFSTSSTEMIAKGDKSSRYCYSGSVDSVAKRIKEYIDTNMAKPAWKENSVDIVSDGKGGLTTMHSSQDHPEVRSQEESFPKSKRVSMINGGSYNLVADVTALDGDSACRTSVYLYSVNTLGGWTSAWRSIDQFIKTEDTDANRVVISPVTESFPAIQPAVVNSVPVVLPVVDNSSSKAPLPQSGNGAQRLKEFKAMYDEGLINKKDFETKKQEILKSM